MNLRNPGDFRIRHCDFACKHMGFAGFISLSRRVWKYAYFWRKHLRISVPSRVGQLDSQETDHIPRFTGGSLESQDGGMVRNSHWWQIRLEVFDAMVGRHPRGVLTVSYWQRQVQSADRLLCFARAWRLVQSLAHSIWGVGIFAETSDMMKFLSLLLLTPLCLAQPDWCQWVPLASQQYVPECSGYAYPSYSGFSCASWCQWVPGPSWGYTPACRSCYQVYSGHYKSAAPPAVVPKTESGCKASCQWLSRPSWNSTSDCMKCEEPLALEAKSGETKPPSPRLKVKMQRPDWCKWVPLGSLQYVGDCTGSAIGASGTGGCANWCGWSPVSAWQYIPECGQCSSGLPEGTVAPMAGCENWCQWVSRPSWQNVGGCAGCEALATNSNAQNEIRPWGFATEPWCKVWRILRWQCNLSHFDTFSWSARPAHGSAIFCSTRKLVVHGSESGIGPDWPGGSTSFQHSITTNRMWSKQRSFCKRNRTDLPRLYEVQYLIVSLSLSNGQAGFPGQDVSLQTLVSYYLKLLGHQQPIVVLAHTNSSGC